ncbi:iron(III) transport system substrate-binding protein [Defluviimonas denitrificans]|jgi:iron(III) transport system substrate-binding protein|uniref:Iron(III) transport system substrate-binding protein n=1 Tax=Albidovulum denitrificans TaxID=404881 RepID=A0A2S8S5M1_9RHOB|nr:ABC transporter substrate-binding protein [Defluviimonas denitrificans]PQV56074.1 iron(III) transport system substrate-binding protein [Defluviimonas denitrificans]
MARSKALLELGTAAMMLAGLANTAGAGELMLYTSQPESDAAETVAAFEAANPDVTVQVFRSGTSDLLTKLAAEFAAGSPQADVLLIADAVSMEGLKADGRLAAYPEANTDGIEASAVDPEGYYFGSKLITTGIVYNTSAAEHPAKWSDLTGPAYKDLVVMPSPLYSGAAAYMLSAFAEREDLGWSFFEQMQANGLTAVRGNGAVLKSVATGENAYGIVVDFLAMNAKKDGAPVEFVFPEEGVTAVTEPVAIMSTAKNPDDAHKFVDFILSDDGQKLALSQGYLPARESVGRPEWLPEGVKVKVMEADVGAIVGKIDENKQRFSTLFGG